MQLSLPTQNFPEPAGPVPAGAAAPATATATAAFETFLPEATAAAAKPAPGTETADPEKAAALLAAGLWLPVTPATPVTAETTTPDGQPACGEQATGEGASTESDQSAGQRDALGFTGRSDTTATGSLPAFSAATSVRSFGSVVTARPTIRPATSGRTDNVAENVTGTSMLISSVETATPTTKATVAAVLTAKPAKAKVAPQTDAPVTASVPNPESASVQLAAQALNPAQPLPAAAPATAMVTAQQASIASPETPVSVRSVATPVARRSGLPAVATAPVAASRPATTNFEASRDERPLAEPVAPDVLSGAPAGLTDSAVAPLASIADRTNFGAPVPPVADEPQAEKIAAPLTANFQLAEEIDLTGKKEILNAGYKSVTTAVSTVGIGVAKVQASMSATPSNRSKPAASASSAAPAVSVSVGTVVAANLSSEAPAPVATLRETMTAVVQAVEALERHVDAASKSVDLKFSVGGEKLDLRVELRDGTVHTTFRTESPELRTALASEWRASVPVETGGSVRLADPVFNAGSAGGEAAFGSAGQGASQQRSPQDRAPAAFHLPHDFLDNTAMPESPTVPSAAHARPLSLLNAFA
jgi:hypothetical protein